MTQHDSSAVLAADFQAAMRAFDAGDYAQARTLTDNFDLRVSKLAHVARRATSPAPAVSIIVVSYQHNEFVPETLREIARQATATGAEVILVDNGNPHFLPLAEKVFSDFTAVIAPINVGCSGGRNLGASLARGNILVFLEDDGVAEADCVRNLGQCLHETGGCAVRGRVEPLTPGAGGAPHYNLGRERVPAVIDCEGVSAWLRDPFLQEGGFDVLLAGHEGFALVCKLWRFFGPLSFLYEPSAVLRHDYASSPRSNARKRAKQTANKAYLEYLGLPTEVARTQGRARNDLRERYLARRALEVPEPTASDEAGTTVSVITTAKNAAPYVEDFSRSWRSQTCGQFELVVVDDGSDDGTADSLAAQWDGDSRLRLHRCPPRGRAAALNFALDHAVGDLCVIADIDDVSIPTRLAETKRFFSTHPDAAYVSYLTFTEGAAFRTGMPHSPFVTDMDVRRLFGMPSSFPSFAFRRQLFTELFDTKLLAGVDLDWLDRNVRAHRLRGSVVPRPLVYYRQHQGQLTRTNATSQKDVRTRVIEGQFAALLGPLTDFDRRCIALLIDRRPAHSAREIAGVGRWVSDLMDANRIHPTLPLIPFEQAMFEAFSDLTARYKIDAGRGPFRRFRRAFRDGFRRARASLQTRYRFGK